MPTMTFTVAASGDDGTIQAWGATYPPSPSNVVTDSISVNAIRRDAASGGGTWVVDVGIVRWDTSGIPDDATVTSASARLRCTGIFDSGGGRSLTAEWYEAGTLGLEDHSHTVGTDAHTGVLLSDLAEMAGVGGIWDADFPLSNAALHINKSGYTGLRFHISGDEPTGWDQVTWASFDNTNYPEAKLIVNYVYPGVSVDFGRHPGKFRRREQAFVA